MGMSAISSAGGSMSVMQMTSTDLKDQKSKNIQNEITDVQQKIQKLSSDEELSANEKVNEREKLQKKKSSLDTELKQHQEELLRSQKREARLAQLLEERNPETAETAEGRAGTSAAASGSADQKDQPDGEAQTLQPGTVITQNSDGTVVLKEAARQTESAEADTESKPVDDAEYTAAKEETEPAAADPLEDTRPSAEEMRAMVTAGSSMQLAARQGTLVAKTEDGIAILKSEIKLDESRGVDTERKQRELEKMEKQGEREQSFQFSILGEVSDTMRSALETDTTKKNPFADSERTFYVSGLSTAQDEQTAQQGFQTDMLKAVSTF